MLGDPWAWNAFYDLLLVLGAAMLVLGTGASILLVLMVSFSSYIMPFAKETFRNLGLWVRGKYSVRKAWKDAEVIGTTQGRKVE